MYMFFFPQESQFELEQLTKELRQVNLQQFIQQTGTKVTVLPVEPSDVEASIPPVPQESGTVLAATTFPPSPSTDIFQKTFQWTFFKEAFRLKA